MNKKEFLALIVILGIAAAFRFYDLTSVPLGLYPDEAMNGSNAQEAIATGAFKVFYPENNGREGLFINLQAVAVALFGNYPWALRGVSALFGTLTVFGIYLVGRELFSRKRPSAAPLFAAFFTAVSFWHINFSRIGFRAIMVPFFASFGLYFLLKGLRKNTIFDIILGGIFIGLGFHTYIAFRFMPFVVAVPLLIALRSWWQSRRNAATTSQPIPTGWRTVACAPCAVLLFLFITFVIALPIGWYFFQHPEDFIGRGGQVSIFATASPAWEFAKSNALTLQMFFWQGDCNWRHNYNCDPELNPLVAVFFLIGAAYTARSLFRKYAGTHELGRGNALTLTAWFGFMTLPATLTAEGLPHALRAIGMIPPVMLIAGYGAASLIGLVRAYLTRQSLRFPQSAGQLSRIRRELLLLFFAALAAIAYMGYRDYFVQWAENKHAYFAFAADLFHQAEYMRDLPYNVHKIIVVNLAGTEVRGIPMPSQTMMFLTDTFHEAGRPEKNFRYILPHELAGLDLASARSVVITFLNGADRKTLQAAHTQFPKYRIWTPGDFVIMENVQKK